MARSSERLANATGPIERKRPAPKAVTFSAKDVPESMSVEQTVDWVSGDARRAEAVLAVERKAEHPRSSLITSMQRLVDGHTGAGIATGEA